jgi:hypothetical protein
MLEEAEPKSTELTSVWVSVVESVRTMKIADAPRAPTPTPRPRQLAMYRAAPAGPPVAPVVAARLAPVDERLVRGSIFVGGFLLAAIIGLGVGRLWPTPKTPSPIGAIAAHTNHRP